ncbi:MAG: DUF2381 family protein [Kofleriaceae bacterium]|nr:DUF2381 family protein [Myxococcales bacterium]MCB9562810.1 DUF2381 family protein [Kofleriaceae bacterium]
MQRVVMMLLVLGLCALAPTASADEAAQSRTILVDEGGSYEVAVHPDYVTVFYFPDKITKALASDPASYEVKAIGATSLAIRPLKPDAKPANLAIATESIKVSVVLSIAKDRGKALTQVTFKRADLEAELQRRIDDEVARRTAELEAKVAELKRSMDAELPKVVEGVVADRVLQRRERRTLNAIERNDDNVIVRVTDALYLGEDGYLVFEIQNRDKTPYRLASAQVLLAGKDKAGLVRLTSSAAETAGEGVIGVVPPRGRGTGVIVLRQIDALLGKSLTLVVTQPDGRGKIVVDRIVLK